MPKYTFLTVKRFLLLPIVFLTLINTVQSQNPWKEFTYDRNTKHIAFQGTDTLWVGTTFGGVYCWKTSDNSYYKNYNRVNDGLPANEITDLAIDPITHEVWITTIHGIAKFSNGQWIQYNTNNTPQLHSNHFVAVTVDNEGVKWFGTTDNGLYGFNGTIWMHYEDIGDGPFDTWVTSIKTSPLDNSLWMGIVGEGIFHFDYKKFDKLDDDTWTQYNSAGNGPMSPVAFVKTVEQNGNPWIWSTTEVFPPDGPPYHHMQVDKCEVGNNYKWVEISTRNTAGFPTDAIHSIAAGIDNYMWMLSDVGLIRFHTITKASQTFNPNAPENIAMIPDAANAYNCNTSDVAFNPSSHQVWLGTTQGLYKFWISDEKFTQHTTFGLPAIPIRDINVNTLNGRTRCWAATGEGLFFKAADEYNTWNRLPLSGASFDNITCLASNQNYLWIGTSLDGVYRWDGSTLVHIPLTIGALQLNANAIIPNNETSNVVWIGTDAGLFRATGTTLHQLPFHHSIACLDKKADGILWIGTQMQGVTKYDGTTWQTYLMTDLGLFNNNISGISSDGNGGVWAGTFGEDNFEAASFNGSTWQTYIRTGTFDNRIRGVVYHPNGPLFVTQEEGIHYFKNFTTWQSYTWEDGLNSNHCRAIYFDQSANGFIANGIWIATAMGVGVIESNIILPVRLIDFTAQSQHNKTVLLNWRTALEENFSHYEIWRTADGNSKKIGSIPGTDAGSYQFTDYSPALGLNTYQLYMVDKDGMVTKSPLRQVRIGLAGATIKITPNPVTAGYMQIAFDKINAKQKVNIRIIDAAAKTVMHQQYELNQGINTIPINTDHLAKGMYFIEIFMANGDAYKEKILVQ